MVKSFCNRKVLTTTASDDLVKAALDGDEKTVAQMVQEAHL